MENVKIVYIDDQINFATIKVLKKLANMNGGRFQFEPHKEISPDSSFTYQDLLMDARVLSADIILIDFRLFPSDIKSDNRFTGEEFIVILRKIFPFIETLVITQEADAIPGAIQKKSNIETDNCYFDRLSIQIEESAKRRIYHRKIVNNLIKNNAFDELLIQRIISSLKGISNYDNLTKSDIDKLIESFCRLEKLVDV